MLKKVISKKKQNQKGATSKKVAIVFILFSGSAEKGNIYTNKAFPLLRYGKPYVNSQRST